MSDEPYYQYAFARPGCSAQEIGPGVDPRFKVELLCHGPVAAVASRVGLDRFDVKKLQGGTAEDIGWLKQVAVRHHEIVRHAAKSSPVLPLRLGTVFQSRASLLAAVARRLRTVTDLLQTLGDRQEWAIKLYLANHYTVQSAGHPSVPSPHRAPTAGSGAEYIKQKVVQLRRRRELQAVLQQEIQAVESQLSTLAERCCRVRALPASLTGRREKMVFNAAFLLPSLEESRWLTTVGQVRDSVRPRGLLLEVTGPSPPYHFCPAPEL